MTGRMSETHVGAARTILENTLEETDDAEVRFRLRTALQLLVAAEEQYEDAREVIEHAEFGDDLQESLRELGYLD